MKIKNFLTMKKCYLIIIVLVIICITLFVWKVSSNSIDNKSGAKKLMTSIASSYEVADFDNLKKGLEDFGCNYMVKEFFNKTKSSDASDAIKIKNYKISDCKFYDVSQDINTINPYSFYVKVNYQVTPVKDFLNTNWSPATLGSVGTVEENTITDTAYFHVIYNNWYYDAKLYPSLYSMEWNGSIPTMN